MSFITKNRLATSDVLTYLILRLISVFGFQGTTFKNISNMNKVLLYSQWRRRDSNSWPPACKAGALPTELRPHFFFLLSGSHLLSHIVSNIVPSAGWGLTIVFEMGTGVSLSRIATGILFASYSHCKYCLTLTLSWQINSNAASYSFP